MDRRRAEREGQAEPDNQVPAGLLEEVFALNEELDTVRAMRAEGAPPEQWKARLQAAREPIERKRAEHEQQLEELFTRWDVVVEGEGDRHEVLQALRERMLERNYINNLLAGIERELTSDD
jgi:hypothetical protein